jgi:FkbM family methyltransferase
MHIGALLLATAGVAWWVVSNDAAGRSHSFASLCIKWQRHWPMERGKFLPMRLERLLMRTKLISTVRYEVEPGVSFLLDPSDVVDIGLLSGEGWDPGVWSMISGNLKPGGTLIDVGAHIGTFTLKAAKVVGEHGRVIAIEPNPQTFAKLRANVEANKFSHVSLIQAACGDKPGRLKLFLGSKVNTGLASLSKQNVVDQGADGQVSVEVDLVPLDRIIEQAGLSRIDVIKVDTEGAETMIVRGAMNALARFRPVLVMETIDHHLRNMGSSLAELDALMDRLGYEISRRDSTDTKWAPKMKR